MEQKNAPASRDAFLPSLPLLPLPYALYDSNGNLFELYQGGQPRRVHEIGWQKLQPIQVPDPVNSDIVSPNSNR